MESSPTTVETIARDASACEAAQRMADTHAGFLVVVEDGRPIGLLTHRDLALRVLATRRDPRTARVEELMTHPVSTLPTDSDPAEAWGLMRRLGVRQVPLVDDRGRLVGARTADELVDTLGRSLGDLAEAIRREQRNEARPEQPASRIFGRE